MGKIRIKTLGLEEEEELKRKEKDRREQKKLRKAKLPGMRGGQKITDASVNQEEFEKIERKAKKEAVEKAFIQEKREKKEKPAFAKATAGKQEEQAEKVAVKVKKAPTSEKKSPITPRKRGQKYQNAAKLVDKKKLYSIEEAIDLVKKTSYSKFKGTFEVHINCLEKGLKVSLTLPHLTGKERRIVVCDDKILEEIAEGKINFDALVATPEYMPKLAHYAKILGPKGLMPNPKARTVTTNPEKVVAELKAGRMDLKTESESPIIHTIIGKVDFDKKDLVENFQKLIEAIGKAKIKSVFVKASMGPSIKVNLL